MQDELLINKTERSIMSFLSCILHKVHINIVYDYKEKNEKKNQTTEQKPKTKKQQHKHACLQ